MSVLTQPADTSDFESFTGITLVDEESERIEVLLERARRALNREVSLDDSLVGDDLQDWIDAECELAWFWWEAEKAGIMEILAMPISQLSLGTLFWTKGTPTDVMTLGAVKRVLGRWGNVHRRRVILDDELGYPAIP